MQVKENIKKRIFKKLKKKLLLTPMQLTALLDVLQSASKVHEKKVRKMTTKEKNLDFTKKTEKLFCTTLLSQF